MTPADAMAARRTRLRLVIFDCDGVLIDSEGIANRTIAEELTALGWAMDEAECRSLFLGWTLADMRPLIEQKLGRALTPAWIDDFAQRLVDRLAAEATTIAGVPDVLHATTALGLPWRIASNSSHREMAAKFARTGMTDLVAGRLHSAEDVARGKPDPALFLAAASAEGVPPPDCVVIEDSIPGVQAAVAAGIPVLGFSRDRESDDALRAAGAVPFHDMRALPGLFRVALRIAA
jgi:HAD superfamily hydrolase (TIGR01509 family)